MKLWITIFSTAVFAGGASLGVVADRKLVGHAHEAPRTDSGWGGGSYEMSVSRFADALDLTDDQNEALDLIITETKRDSEAYRRAIRVSNDRAKEKVTALLTEEQKQRLDALMAEERTRRGERDVERTLKFYTTVLELTQAQAGPVRVVLADQREKRRTFLTSNAHGGDHAKMRAFMKGLRAEQMKRFETILTAVQMKKYGDLGDWWE